MANKTTPKNLLPITKSLLNFVLYYHFSLRNNFICLDFVFLFQYKCIANYEKFVTFFLYYQFSLDEKGKK